MSDPSVISEKASWCMNNFDDLYDLLDASELGRAVLPNLTQVGIDKLYDLMQAAELVAMGESPDLKNHWSYGGSK